MGKETFNSIWGDLQVGQITAAPDKKKEDKKDPDENENKTDDEVIEDGTKKVEKPGEKEEVIDDKKDPDEKKGDEDEEEYEYTEDDISKAYGMMEEEGVLELGEDEEFEMTVPGLADAIGATVQNKLKKEIAAIPPVVQEFYGHIIAGKEVSSFVASKAEVLWDDYDITEAEAQKHTLRALYKSQGMSDEDIEEEITDIEATDKLEKKAIAGKTTLAGIQATNIAARTTAKAEADKKATNDRTAEVEKIKASIDSTEEMAGFKLDDKRREAFKKYLFDLNPRTSKTQMQENMADEERRLRIAFLDFVDYTKADLTKAEVTRLSKKHKKKLSRYTDKNVKNSNSSSTVKTKSDQQKGKLIIPGMFGTDKIEIED